MSETTAKIYSALLAIAKALPGLKKKSVGGDRAKFDAFLTEDIVGSLRDLMIEHGVFVVPRAIERQTEFLTAQERTVARHYVFVNHVFYADDGSSLETATFGEGSGYNEEGLSKAMTRSLGAALREVFMIVDVEKAEKSARKEAAKNFGQFWEKCKELKITDGKQVLAQHDNDPLKAFEFICTRATTPKHDPPPSPKVEPPAQPRAVEPPPPPVEAERSEKDLLLDEIKLTCRNVGFARNPDQWKSFQIGLAGCELVQLTTNALRVFRDYTVQAATNSIILAWLAEDWKCSTDYRAGVVGLIVAHAGMDGFEKTRALCGDPHRLYSFELIEKLRFNLLSWVRPDELANQRKAA